MVHGVELESEQGQRHLPRQASGEVIDKKVYVHDGDVTTETHTVILGYGEAYGPSSEFEDRQSIK